MNTAANNLILEGENLPERISGPCKTVDICFAMPIGGYRIAVVLSNGGGQMLLRGQGVVFMSGFSKKEKYEEFLRNIDYIETAKNIRTMMLALNKETKIKGFNCYCRNDFIKAKVSFSINPCFDTAVKLMEAAPSSVALFVTKGVAAYSEEVWREIITGLNIEPKMGYEWSNYNKPAPNKIQVRCSRLPPQKNNIRWASALKLHAEMPNLRRQAIKIGWDLILSLLQPQQIAVYK